MVAAAAAVALVVVVVVVARSRRRFAHVVRRGGVNAGAAVVVHVDTGAAHGVHRCRPHVGACYKYACCYCCYCCCRRHVTDANGCKAEISNLLQKNGERGIGEAHALLSDLVIFINTFTTIYFKLLRFFLELKPFRGILTNILYNRC